MNKIALAFFVIMSALSLSAYAQTTTDRDGIAVVVNNTILTEQDVAAHSRLIAQQFNQELPAPILRQRALTDLIDQELKAQYAQKYEATNAEVDAAFATLAQRNNLTPAQLQSMSAGAESALFHKLKVQVQWDKLLRAEIIDEIDIQTPEVDRILKDLAGQDLTDEVELGQIISQNASQTEVVTEYFSQGVGNKNFELMAGRINTGILAEKNGYLGWLERASLAPDVQAALTNQPVGSIVGPLALSAGQFQWLKIYRARRAPKLNFEPIDFIKTATLTLTPDAVNTVKELEVDYTQWPLSRWADIEGAQLAEKGWQPARNRPELQDQALRYMTPDLLTSGTASILIARKKDMDPALTAARARTKEKILGNRARMQERQLLRKLKSQAFIDIK